MPTSDVRPSEGQVYCQMVYEQMPILVCIQEQGGPRCKGCAASSRRCVLCTQPGKIADAEEGWCADCATKQGKPTAELQAPLGAIDDALSDAVRNIKLVNAVPVRPRSASNVERDSTGPPSLERDPITFYHLLREHGIQRGSVWMVKAPVQVLLRRAPLLRDEVLVVLAALVEQEYLTGSTPWDSVVLCRTMGIEALKARLERGQGSSGTTRSVSTVERKASMERPLRIVPGRSGARGRVLSTSRAHEALVAAARMVNGERVLRGAIPVLQLALQLAQRVEAITLLEQLRSAGLVVQVDEWRTIRLPETALAVLPFEEPEVPSESVSPGEATVLRSTYEAMKASYEQRLATLQAQLKQQEREHATASKAARRVPLTPQVVVELAGPVLDASSVPLLASGALEYEDDDEQWVSVEHVLRTVRSRKGIFQDTATLYAKLVDDRRVRKLLIRHPDGTTRNFFAANNVWVALAGLV